ncbi:translocation/assembly module TamB domain-containing protein [Pseudovibrio sp. SPO723]|uniref:translocation/assembly module TamB domain-containing protein n=1 Tax=Nesiotobacter zosterae TaxID=392721 RepID=UPI0029C4A299|nr:translocation/assembly module TamB domain-containing protein [Pseudovibrio sp. SPO723]MDX5593639.1 translocation/assembly module TamB domain-containing protein [Pseudovibrio sp. SPO723]
MILRILGVLARLVLTVIALVAISYGALVATSQVEQGRVALGNVITTFVPGIEVDAPALSLGGNLEVARVALRDADGEWLSVDGIALDWSPLALIRGNVEIERLSAASVSVVRRPSLAPETETDTDSTAEQQATSLPFAGSVQDFSVQEISIARSVLGEPITLSLNGSASVTPTPEIVSLTIQAERLDSIKGSVDATVTLNLADFRFDVDTMVSEAPGGLIASLLEIPQSPSFDFDLIGKGSLDALEANMALALDGVPTVGGSITMDRQGADRLFSADLNGDLQSVLPSDLEGLFTGQTQLVANGTLDDTFFPTRLDASLATNAIFIKANGSIEKGSRTALLKANVGTRQPSGSKLALPIPEIGLSLDRFDATLTADGALEALDWTLVAESAGVVSELGNMQSLRLNAQGTGASALADQLRTPLKANMVMEGVELKGGEFAKHLPTAASLSMEGAVDLSAQTARISYLSAVSDEASLRLEDVVASTQEITALGMMQADDLTRYAGLAQRPLAGAATLNFELVGSPQERSANIRFRGQTQDLQIGVLQADNLLRGVTTLSGHMDARIPEDFPAQGKLVINDAEISSDQFSISTRTSLENGAVDGEFQLSISDLSMLDSRVTGELSATSTIQGPVDAAQLDVEATTQDLEMLGTPVDDLELNSSLVLSASAPEADVSLRGSLRDREILLTANLKPSGDGAAVENLEVRVGDNEASGEVQIANLGALPAGITGHLDVNAPQLAQISPLVLAPIDGALVGRVQVQDLGGEMRIDLDTQASAFVWESIALESLSAQARILKALSEPEVDGEVTLSNLNAGAVVVSSANATSRTRGNETAVVLNSVLDGPGDTFDAEVVLRQLDDGLEVDVNQIAGAYRGLETKLKEPSRISAKAGMVSLNRPLILALGDGSVTVTGAGGENLDLALQVDQLPLELVNALAPSLGLQGRVNATAEVTGAPASPSAQWQVNAEGVGIAVMRQNEISPFAITSSGNLRDNVVTQETKVTSNAGLDLASTGKVSLAQGGSLDVQASGRVPLEVLRARLIRTGLTGSGFLNLSAKANGALSAPQFTATATPDGMEITQLATGLTLENFSGAVEANQERVAVNNLGANLRTGGTIRVNGTVGLNEGLPIAVTAVVDQGRYIQGTLADVLIDADMNMSGPLAAQGQAPRLSGTVTIQRADIGIPSSFGGGVSPVVVRHLNAPKPVMDQARALAIDAGETGDQSAGGNGGTPIELDLNVNAPSKIFVRGRGLNAEVGGSLRLAGTTSDIEGIGGFQLIRGRFDILSRRLEFQQGSVTFDGSLTPYLNFAATTATSSANVTIGIVGEATEPEITLSSSPELPQDEILAQLLFGQSVTDLSPVQIAQLASAVTTLAGGSSEGPLGALRNVLGLSDIDVNVNSEGQAELSAGTYINDNIYLGVKQNAKDGSNAANVDIEVTKDLRIRGEAGSTGDTKAGFYFEREY